MGGSPVLPRAERPHGRPGGSSQNPTDRPEIPLVYNHGGHRPIRTGDPAAASGTRAVESSPRSRPIDRPLYPPDSQKGVRHRILKVINGSGIQTTASALPLDRKSGRQRHGVKHVVSGRNRALGPQQWELCRRLTPLQTGFRGRISSKGTPRAPGYARVKMRAEHPYPHVADAPKGESARSRNRARYGDSAG